MRNINSNATIPSLKRSRRKPVWVIFCEQYSIGKIIHPRNGGRHGLKINKDPNATGIKKMVKCDMMTMAVNSPLNNFDVSYNKNK
jgi:hypothetical protein